MDYEVIAVGSGVIGTCIAGFFKSNIGNWFRSLKIYRNRQFDDDIKETVEFCQLHSSATGEWGTVAIVDYQFPLPFRATGVIIRHFWRDATDAEAAQSDHWGKVVSTDEFLPYNVWDKIRRRPLDKVTLDASRRLYKELLNE